MIRVAKLIAALEETVAVLRRLDALVAVEDAEDFAAAPARRPPRRQARERAPARMKTAAATTAPSDRLAAIKRAAIRTHQQPSEKTRKQNGRGRKVSSGPRTSPEPGALPEPTPEIVIDVRPIDPSPAAAVDASPAAAKPRGRGRGRRAVELPRALFRCKLPHADQIAAGARCGATVWTHKLAQHLVEVHGMSTQAYLSPSQFFDVVEAG